MGRSMRDLRQTLAPITEGDTAGVRSAVPPDRLPSLPERIKVRRQQLTQGIKK